MNLLLNFQKKLLKHNDLFLKSFSFKWSALKFTRWNRQNIKIKIDISLISVPLFNIDSYVYSFIFLLMIIFDFLKKSLHGTKKLRKICMDGEQTLLEPLLLYVS